MKFIRTEEIEITPTNVDLFIRSFSELPDAERGIFFSEFGEQEETGNNNAQRLLEHLVLSKAFNEVWEPYQAAWILPVWKHFKKELERGYYIHTDQYKKYPVSVVNTFLINDEDLPQSRALLKAAFENQTFISFRDWYKEVAQEMFEDEQ